MWAQKTELLQQISAQGWTTTELEDWEVEDWADEIWLLESVWSPIGSRAYLTFLVDNGIDNWHQRKKGESVWAAEISLSKPKYGLQDEHRFLISLNQGWRKEMPALLKHLSMLRGKSQAA